MKEQTKEAGRLVRGFHYAFILFVVLLAGFCVWFIYVNLEPAPMEVPQEVQEEAGHEGTAKPLPDFIVDDIPPNELEDLKP